MPFQPPNPRLPDMPQEEQQSLLGKIASGALTGLGYLGSTLDKWTGGRAARGLLGGNAEELLSLIPGSDVLGITRPEDAVSGRDLLEKAGLADAPSEDESFFHPSNLAGIATELLTSPATYLSFGGGALTKAGQAAQKAGVLPKSMAARAAGFAADSPELAATAAKLGTADGLAGARLGGQVGVGLPFGLSDQATYLLSELPGYGALSKAGELAGKIPGVGPALDYAGGVGRSLGAMFQKSRGGQTDPTLVGAAQKFHEELPGAQAAKMTDELLPLREKASELGLLGTSKLGQLYEGTFQGPLTQAEQDLVGMQRGILDRNLAESQAAGRNVQAANPEGFAYSPRYDALSELKGGKVQSLAPGQEQAREGILSNLSRQKVDEMVTRPDYEGLTKGQVTERIRQDYLGLDPASQRELFDLKKLHEQGQTTGAEYGRLETLETKYKQAENLADWHQSLDRQARREVGGFYGDAQKNLEDKVLKDAEKNLRAKVLTGTLADVAEPMKPGLVPLHKVLKDGNLTYGLPEGKLGVPAATSAEISMQLPAGGENVLTSVTDALAKKLGKPVTNEVIATMGVRPEVAEGMTKILRAATDVGAASKFGELFDSATNLTKNMQTAWPATLVRNRFTDMWDSWVHGFYDPTVAGGAANPAAYFSTWNDARKVLGGQTSELAQKIPGLAGMSAEEASKALAREILAFKLTRSQQAMQEVGKTGLYQNVKEMKIPGEALTEGFGGAARKFVPTEKASFNPFEVRGVGGRVESKFAPVAGMQALENEADAVKMTAGYLAKRLQGFEPAEAMKAVKSGYRDFSNLSEFERKYMTRIAPFYNWARQNLGQIAEETLSKPGGKVASSIKVGGEARGENQALLPTTLGGGVALPVGSEEDGHQRFLSSLGLPIEDLGQLTTGGGPLGALNPLIKAPIEQLTGHQFFSGRDLRDLYSRTGLPQPAENLLMNSPLGRAVSTASTFMDPRKDLATALLNTTTGVRMSDVDLDQARQMRQRQIVEDVMRGNPNLGVFQRMYVRPGQQQALTPEDMANFQLYQTLERQRQRQARAAQGGQ